MSIERWIALAIARTTGPGDEKPYLFRVLSWLMSQCPLWGPGVADEVAWYLQTVDCIPCLDYPRSGMH